MHKLLVTFKLSYSNSIVLKYLNSDTNKYIYFLFIIRKCTLKCVKFKFVPSIKIVRSIFNVTLCEQKVKSQKSKVEYLKTMSNVEGWNTHVTHKLLSLLTRAAKNKIFCRFMKLIKFIHQIYVQFLINFNVYYECNFSNTNHIANITKHLTKFHI